MKNDDNLMECLCDSEDEILEWWLITPFLAELLKREGETVIQHYDCHWWGRTQSGQAIYMDGVIGKIAKRFE